MPNGRASFLLVALALVTACSGDAISPGTENSVITPSAVPSLSSHSSAAITVSNVDALYTAINDAANAGKRLRLAAGTYVLDGNRPNGGRLELQKDMILSGVNGHEASVVIDASALSAAALTAAGQVSGAIRMGRGHNTVEWLSITKTINGAAGITTDLLLAGATTITISHVVASGGARGFDIRNVGAAAAGRVLEVQLNDNELANNSLGSSQGLRIANLAGAQGARIHATLNGNSSHGNIAGFLAANVSADSAIVNIESTRDHFDANGNGVILLGGNATGTAVIRGSLIRFSAFESTFKHNTETLPAVFPTRAGIAPYGGVSTAANRAFDNRVELILKNVSFADNGGPDVRAWGAITTAATPAGTGNIVSVSLKGSSKKVTVETIGSDPVEAAGTNKVIVQR
jgi:hypothetical protein